MDWQEIAKSLRIGQSRKIPCCGSSPSTYVSQTDHGLRLGPCFRCGHTEFVKHGKRSASEILAARRALPSNATFTLPSTAVPISSETVPSPARLWFLKHGITPEQADDWGCRWDGDTGDGEGRTPSRRVLIPVEGGYLSRAVLGERPKWVNFCPKDIGCVRFHRTGASRVVVVEDVLSAYKVYLAGYASICALGTTITTQTRLALCEYERITGWFDDDAAGDKAWTKLRQAMRLNTGTLDRVITPDDPKVLHYGAIKEKLC